MSERSEARDRKLANDRAYKFRVAKKYPPPDLAQGADFFWRLLLPEVTSNPKFMPSWIMALRCLCNLLIEEKFLLDSLVVTGAIGVDAMKLELARSRIAQFANYCGLGPFLIEPAIPSLREMVTRKEKALYESSIMTFLDPGRKEEHEEEKKKKGEW